LIAQRTGLTPNDFPSRADVKDRLLRVEEHDCAAARSVRWTYSREVLRARLAAIAAHAQACRKAA
jgi:hypothetical protein